MSLRNHNWITFGGAPVTGMTPTRVTVYAQPGQVMNAEQDGFVTHAYKLFCDAINVSAIPDGYHRRDRIAPDGTVVRMTSMQGQHVIEVWLPGRITKTLSKLVPSGFHLFPLNVVVLTSDREYLNNDWLPGLTGFSINDLKQFFADPWKAPMVRRRSAEIEVKHLSKHPYLSGRESRRRLLWESGGDEERTIFDGGSEQFSPKTNRIGHVLLLNSQEHQSWIYQGFHLSLRANSMPLEIYCNGELLVGESISISPLSSLDRPQIFSFFDEGTLSTPYENRAFQVCEISPDGSKIAFALHLRASTELYEAELEISSATNKPRLKEVRLVTQFTRLTKSMEVGTKNYANQVNGPPGTEVVFDIRTATGPGAEWTLGDPPPGFPADSMFAWQAPNLNWSSRDQAQLYRWDRHAKYVAVRRSGEVQSFWESFEAAGYDDNNALHFLSREYQYSAVFSEIETCEFRRNIIWATGGQQERRERSEIFEGYSTKTEGLISTIKKDRAVVIKVYESEASYSGTFNLTHPLLENEEQRWSITLPGGDRVFYWPFSTLTRTPVGNSSLRSGYLESADFKRDLYAFTETEITKIQNSSVNLTNNDPAVRSFSSGNRWYNNAIWGGASAVGIGAFQPVEQNDWKIKSVLYKIDAEPLTLFDQTFAEPAGIIFNAGDFSFDYRNVQAEAASGSQYSQGPINISGQMRKRYLAYVPVHTILRLRAPVMMLVEGDCVCYGVPRMDASFFPALSWSVLASDGNEDSLQLIRGNVEYTSAPPDEFAVLAPLGQHAVNISSAVFSTQNNPP